MDLLTVRKSSTLKWQHEFNAVFKVRFCPFLFVLWMRIHPLSQTLPTCKEMPCCFRNQFPNGWGRYDLLKSQQQHSFTLQQLGNSTSGYSLLWSPWQGSTEQNGTSVWPQAKEATSSALFSCFLSLSSPLFSPDSFDAGLLPHLILSAVSDTTWLTQELAIESKACSQEGGGEIGFFNYTN